MAPVETDFRSENAAFSGARTVDFVRSEIDFLRSFDVGGSGELSELPRERFLYSCCRVLRGRCFL